MRASAGRRVLLLVLAIAVSLSAVGVQPIPVAAQGDDGPATTFGFAIQPTGDARVSVTTRFPLASEADREGFDRVARDHTGGEASPLVVDPFERAATLSAEANGRPMEIRGVARAASRTNDTGRLTLEFTWTNFAEPAEDELAVGDAFRTPNGTWLPRIAADQELRISFPADYSPQSITVPGTRYQLVNRTVRVEGPATFEPDTPSLVLQETEPPTGPPYVLFTAAAVGVAVLAIGAYLFRDRFRSAVGAVHDSDDGTGPDVTEPADEPDPAEAPLLSDEERVVELLAANGGRMKQVEIVEATDWSNAKVSQLLSEMAEDGQIDKLRIGRENLISLPGHGPGGD